MFYVFRCLDSEMMVYLIKQTPNVDMEIVIGFIYNGGSLGAKVDPIFSMKGRLKQTKC